MKIKKYQIGGIYYTPFFRDSISSQESQHVGNNSSTNNNENLIQKEIINTLKENGLPNDVDYFLSKANTFLRKSQNLVFNTTEDSYDLSDLIRIQSLANRIKHNNNLYEKAREQIISENSGSEIAITNTGGMYVLDENGIKTISANTYYKNPEKYQILTNSELIKLRANQPELAYNSTILTDLSNTVGMKSIVEYVKDTISSFGTNKSSSKYDRYTIKQKGQIEKGFEQLLGFDSPDGVYKGTISQSVEDQGYSDEKSLNAAINYLYSTLPENMKHSLRANTAAEGLDPNDINNVRRLLTSAITEHTDHSVNSSTSLDYGKTASEAKGTRSSTSGTPVQIPFGAFVQRNMGDVRSSKMIFSDSSLNFNIPSYYYNNRDIEGKSLPDVITASDADRNLRDHGIRDPYNKAYFGGIPLTEMAIDGQNIIVNNEKGLVISYLPVDSNGNLDITVMKIMSNIQNQIEQNHITDETQIQKIWEDNGFQYDASKKVGVIPGMQLKRFAIQQAYTTSNGSIENKVLKNDEFVDQVDDNLIEDLIGIYNNDPGNKNKQKLDIDAGWFGSSYQGLLFIPLSNNENEANMAGGLAYTPKSDADMVKANQDFARQNGAYDINTGIYNRNLNGTTASSLD